MVIFHCYVNVYQRVYPIASNSWMIFLFSFYGTSNGKNWMRTEGAAMTWENGSKEEYIVEAIRLVVVASTI